MLCRLGAAAQAGCGCFAGWVRVVCWVQLPSCGCSCPAGCRWCAGFRSSAGWAWCAFFGYGGLEGRGRYQERGTSDNTASSLQVSNIIIDYVGETAAELVRRAGSLFFSLLFYSILLTQVTRVAFAVRIRQKNRQNRPPPPGRASARPGRGNGATAREDHHETKTDNQDR